MTAFKRHHGTTQASANRMFEGNIDATMGSGELGQGFYTGEYFYEAVAWTNHAHKRKPKAILIIEIQELDFWNLSVSSMDYHETVRLMQYLKANSKTSSYTKGVDVIWADIVGATHRSIHGDQMKFEKGTSETLLNGDSVYRSVTPV